MTQEREIFSSNTRRIIDDRVQENRYGSAVRAVDMTPES
jgi:hypothetical protein